jgi:hypothetical protein
MADFMSARQMEMSSDDEVRADLKKRDVAYCRLLAREDPKTALALGPEFLEYIGILPRAEKKALKPDNDDESKQARAMLRDVFTDEIERMEARLQELQDTLFAACIRRPSSAIIQEVAKKYELNAVDLVGPSRSKKFIAARFEAIARIRDELGYSLPHIGQIFGDRDHTSIMYAYNTHHGIRSSKSRLQRQDSA